jgi:hypothetical protein
MMQLARWDQNSLGIAGVNCRVGERAGTEACASLGSGLSGWVAVSRSSVSRGKLLKA